MSLKAFHVVFVLASIALAVWFGVWAAGRAEAGVWHDLLVPLRRNAKLIIDPATGTQDLLPVEIE